MVRAPLVIPLILLPFFAFICFLTLYTLPVLAAIDTYPAPWRPPTIQDSMYDTWGEYNRECTSYVSWMLHSVNGFEMPRGGNSGFPADAVNWGPHATALGYTVDMDPAVGSIYWTVAGHVAYVESIPDSTHVQIEDYNSDGTGHWAERTVLTNSASGYIHFKDLQAPSDIAWYESWNNGTITIAKGSASGPMAGTTTFLTGYGKPDWAGVGDFNGDGKQDIAWYESGPGTITIAYGDGAGHVQSYYTMISGRGKPDWAGVGDFNGDGKDDIAWFEAWNGGKITIALGSASGSAAGYTTFQTGWNTPTWAGVGDFNGDSKADIAWYQSGTGNVLVAYGNGAGGVQSYYNMISGWGAPDWAGVGDFNNDGKSDIAWYEAWNHGTITIAQGSASGPMAGTTIFQTGWSTPTWAGVGDFNGDGNADIAWYETSNSNVLVAYGNGAGYPQSYYNMITGWGAPDWAEVGKFSS